MARKILIRCMFPPFMLLTLLAAFSCGGPSPGEGEGSPFVDDSVWKKQGLTDYDFTVTRNCFCPEDWRGPVNIQVRGGVPVSVTYVSDGSEVTEGKFDNADTIEDLFTILKNAYTDDNSFGEKASRVEVSYDPDMGYPSEFYIDYSELVADEEQGYTVTNLVAR